MSTEKVKLRHPRPEIFLSKIFNCLIPLQKICSQGGKFLQTFTRNFARPYITTMSLYLKDMHKSNLRLFLSNSSEINVLQLENNIKERKKSGGERASRWSVLLGVPLFILFVVVVVRWILH